MPWIKYMLYQISESYRKPPESLPIAKEFICSHTWDIILYFLWKEFEYCCGK